MSYFSLTRIGALINSLITGKAEDNNVIHKTLDEEKIGNLTVRKLTGDAISATKADTGNAVDALVSGTKSHLSILTQNGVHIEENTTVGGEEIIRQKDAGNGLSFNSVRITPRNVNPIDESFGKADFKVQGNIQSDDAVNDYDLVTLNQLNSKEDKVSGVLALGTNDYTATVPEVTQLVTGLKILVTFENPNTAVSRMKLNGLSDEPIVKNYNTPVSAGDLTGTMILMYSLDKWVVVGSIGGSGGGAVDSVNGQTGVVVLDADDVGAIPITGSTAGNPIIGDLNMPFDAEYGLVFQDIDKRFGFEIGGEPRMVNIEFATEDAFFTLSQHRAYIQGTATNFEGITGENDYSANYGPNTYVQKTYVDTKAPLTPRVQSITSSATVTPTSTNDIVTITAQAVALTLANPTGTFEEGQALMIRIKDNGTAQAITFGSNYRAIGVTLPTTTIANKILYLGIIYDSIDAKWNILGINLQA